MVQTLHYRFKRLRRKRINEIRQREKLYYQLVKQNIQDKQKQYFLNQH